MQYTDIAAELHRLRDDQRREHSEAVRAFSMQLLSEPIQLTANEFFPLNYAFVGAVCVKELRRIYDKIWLMVNVSLQELFIRIS